MTRLNRHLLFLSCLIMVSASGSAFAKNQVSGKPNPTGGPPTVKEQIQRLEMRIQRYQQEASKDHDPRKKELVDQMVEKLSVVKSYKVKELNEGKLSKEDRMELKEAYIAFRELKHQFNTLDKGGSEKAVGMTKPPPSNPATYETASGFKVRLRLAE